MIVRTLLVILLLTGAPVVRAELSLHSLFRDGVVLQRDRPLPVWGEAAPGGRVVVRLGERSAETHAGPDGRWAVVLGPLPASAEPAVLEAVSGTASVAVRDVVVGEVWLASGQSNMAAPLSSGASARALEEARDPLLRVFTVRRDVAASPRRHADGRWQATTPENARSFSAVGYFFARELRAALGVPVGLVNASWGGTPIKTWMSEDSLRRPPALVPLVTEWETALARHRESLDHPERLEAYYREMKEWETAVDAPYRAARRAYEEEAARARAAGLPPPPAPRHARPEPVIPDPIAFPAASKRPATPTITYNAMIAPLVPFRLRGVIWYQGEADGMRGVDYRLWLPRLIAGWREAWGDDPIAFGLVQLPAHGPDPSPVATAGWPWLREAQARALEVPGTFLAVTLDIGDPADVHPDNKVHVGRRLALAARRDVYGEAVIASGPRYRTHTIEGAAIRIGFTDVGGGLVIRRPPWRPATAGAVPADRLEGFFIAGADRRWMPADASIEGATVRVSADGLHRPVAVRYGWANSPVVNLYNREGLPAAPFRTDDWDR